MCYCQLRTDISKKGQRVLARFLWVPVASLCFPVGMGFCHGEQVKKGQNVTADLSASRLRFGHMPLLCGEVGAEGRLVESTPSLCGFSFRWERQSEVNSSSRTLKFPFILWTPGTHKDRAEQTGFWCSKGSGVNNRLHHEVYFPSWAKIMWSSEG